MARLHTCLPSCLCVCCRCRCWASGTAACYNMLSCRRWMHPPFPVLLCCPFLLRGLRSYHIAARAAPAFRCAGSPHRQRDLAPVPLPTCTGLCCFDALLDRVVALGAFLPLRDCLKANLMNNTGGLYVAERFHFFCGRDAAAPSRKISPEFVRVCVCVCAPPQVPPSLLQTSLVEKRPSQRQGRFS